MKKIKNSSTTCDGCKDKTGQCDLKCSRLSEKLRKEGFIAYGNIRKDNTAEKTGTY